MNHIHVLDQTTIDKIAAGEVVERPASIVKELVENSIDAGAARINVEIRDGGISMIRITDNGRGIAPEDIPLVFKRHATSKLEKINDLDTIASFGFRGEALSSIAAVSRVELITKRPEDLAATRYLIEGGREKLREEIGAPDGTTIIVRDLFYNTPARAKFLKTPLTEAAHVGEIAEQLILSNPGIAFTLTVNGQTKLTSGGSGRLENAIFSIYGRSLKDLLVSVSEDFGWLRLDGFIGKPEFTRGNRNLENYYVNGRYVKSRLIAKAIEDGFGTKLMQHRYPFTCFKIDIDGTAVDVNVHPTKMDVRFSDEKEVYTRIKNAVADALSKLEMIVASSVNPSENKAGASTADKIPRVKPLQAFETDAGSGTGEPEEVEHLVINTEELSTAAAAAGSGTSRSFGTIKPPEAVDLSAVPERIPSENAVIYAEETESLFSGVRESSERIAEKAGSVHEKKGKWEQQSFLPGFLTREAKPLRRIIGQVFNTYWICEFNEKMYLFDQHAAHERVLFEKLMTLYSKRELTSQQMSPPEIITLDSREQALLKTYSEAFSGLGFEIEEFGGNEFAVRAVPYALGALDFHELFRSLLDELETGGGYEMLEIYVRRVATEACKAAVKGGERISSQEAEKLLDDMMNCEDPYHCPHGRPTIISFTRSDLEKRFKRIV